MTIKEYICDACGGKVTLNRNDHYECHECHTQFTTADEPSLPQVRLQCASGGRPLGVHIA